MRTKDLFVGVAMTAAGVAYLTLANNLPERDGVDGATVPGVLAGMMIVLGLIETIGAWRRDPIETPKIGREGVVTVGLTLLLIAGFVAALRPLGFPLATALYLFLQFLVLTPRDTRPRLPLYAGLAAASAAVIFATFRYGFDLMLPAGPLIAWLN